MIERQTQPHQAGLTQATHEESKDQLKFQIVPPGCPHREVVPSSSSAPDPSLSTRSRGQGHGTRGDTRGAGTGGSNGLDLRKLRELKLPKTEEEKYSDDVKGDKPSQQLLTIDEVSVRLQVPCSWIYERTRHNEIPHIKLGKYLRFKWSEVEKWLAESSSSLKISGKRRLWKGV